MPKLNGRVPTYRLHRHSGQAIVTLCGTDHYLGPFGSEPSRALYDRLIGEWLARGRRPERPPEEASAVESPVTIEDVIHGFWQHAEIHYRKPDGSPTSELDNFRQALRPLRRLYGISSVAAFGPKALKAVRENMIERGWCRSQINKQVSRLKTVFRWGVENELVPASVHQALLAVKGLQRGRSTARETPRVRPVPENLIAAIRPFVSRQVWALVQLQQLTAARPGELVRLRGVDLQASGKIWTVEPLEHKTAHHDIAKRIYFGPQAQAILKPFLQDRSLADYLFSPREAEAERHEKLHEARRTPLSCGNRPGTNRKSTPKRPPATRYTVDSYRQAIWRACDQAFPPPEHLVRVRIEGKHGTRWETVAEWRDRLKPEGWAELKAWRKAHRWHPHQLRHNAGTHLRKEFGIEIARVILGHQSASMTEIYAELDEEKARKAIRKIG